MPCASASRLIHPVAGANALRTLELFKSELGDTHPLPFAELKVIFRYQ
jgi:hypothetical protein